MEVVQPSFLGANASRRIGSQIPLHLIRSLLHFLLTIPPSIYYNIPLAIPPVRKANGQTKIAIVAHEVVYTFLYILTVTHLNTITIETVQVGAERLI